ncbi:MAG: purine-nucleoside phosphorylase [Eubacteriaceae bacterium]
MDMNNKFEQVLETCEFIKSKTPLKPTLGLILGSGLGILGDECKNAIVLDYQEIPNFLVSTVQGHSGRLVIGELEGKIVVAMQGRFHYYEGQGMAEITFPVYVMKALGVESIIVTNAAGCCNTDYQPGDLMIISDHLNLSGNNPLIGENDDRLGPRFPDVSNAYDKELINLAEKCGKNLDIPLRKGVYAYFSGPCYETPAEVRMAQILGASAVGMSTAPEAIVAAHAGLPLLGISCLTNMAAGILDQPLDHAEVIEVTQQGSEKFTKLIKGIIKSI